VHPKPLLEQTPRGLYCEIGDFYVDPWKSVDRAVITHAHGDHIYPGCKSYLTSAPGRGVLQTRLADARIETRAYGEKFSINGVTLSLHPAGHILGSAQVRLEHEGRVTVATGDLKLDWDPTTPAFEMLACDNLFLDATFSLPIYRWPDSRVVMAEMSKWWAENQSAGRNSVVFAYALGKAERILAGLDPTQGPILAHGAVMRFVPVYNAEGVKMPAVLPASPENAALYKGKALVVAPPSALNTPWLRKFAPFSTGFASGWMQIRGAKRRKNVDRGFVISDHADWDDLLRIVKETGASNVTVMHGFPNVLSRYLIEKNGLNAVDFKGRWGGDDDMPLAADEAGA
jgi:putative mRNA 3-end processing factor